MKGLNESERLCTVTALLSRRDGHGKFYDDWHVQLQVQVYKMHVIDLFYYFFRLFFSVVSG